MGVDGPGPPILEAPEVEAIQLPEPSTPPRQLLYGFREPAASSGPQTARGIAPSSMASRSSSVMPPQTP